MLVCSYQFKNRLDVLESQKNMPCALCPVHPQAGRQNANSGSNTTIIFPALRWACQGTHNDQTETLTKILRKLRRLHIAHHNSIIQAFHPSSGDLYTYANRFRDAFLKLQACPIKSPNQSCCPRFFQLWHPTLGYGEDEGAPGILCVSKHSGKGAQDWPHWPNRKVNDSTASKS